MSCQYEMGKQATLRTHSMKSVKQNGNVSTLPLFADALDNVRHTPADKLPCAFVSYLSSWPILSVRTTEGF